MKITIEQKRFDEWKTESDIDEYHRQNIEVYDMTDEEYEKFIKEIENGKEKI